MRHKVANAARRRATQVCVTLALLGPLCLAAEAQGTFSLTADLINGRRDQTATLLKDGEHTPPQVATRIGVSRNTVLNWINDGYLPARRGPVGRWAIPFPPETEQACRQRAATSQARQPFERNAV